MSKKLPALMFYPGDWWKDPNVQMLDHFHKGLWFELLLIMFDAEERGKLSINGKPMASKLLAKRLAVGEQELDSAIALLLEVGVCHRDENGILYNKRLVRDDEISKAKQNAGHLGGLAKSKNKQKASKTPSKSVAAPETEYEDEIEDVDEDLKINSLELDTVKATFAGAGLSGEYWLERAFQLAAGHYKTKIPTLAQLSRGWVIQELLKEKTQKLNAEAAEERLKKARDGPESFEEKRNREFKEGLKKWSEQNDETGI